MAASGLVMLALLACALGLTAAQASAARAQAAPAFPDACAALPARTVTRLAQLPSLRARSEQFTTGGAESFETTLTVGQCEYCRVECRRLPRALLVAAGSRPVGWCRSGSVGTWFRPSRRS